MGYPMGATATVLNLSHYNVRYTYQLRLDVNGDEFAVREDEIARTEEPDPGILVYVTENEVNMLTDLLLRIQERQYAEKYKEDTHG